MNTRNPNTLRLATLIGLWLGSAGCGTVPDPTLSCSADSECNNGQQCKLGRCLAAGAFVCTAVADCEAALGDGSWTPTEAGACRAAACEESVCVMVAKAAGSACEDGDGIACTLGACDAEGECTVAANLTADTCLIDDNGSKSCVAADANNPSNGCQACIPSIDPRKWTDKPNGAGCDDADGLSCTQGACNGSGTCQPAGIATGFCVIDGKCRKTGDAADGSAGCKVCDPISAKEAWSDKADGTTCSEDGATCRPGACKAGSCVIEGISAGFCFIAGDGGSGTCIADGDADPNAPCQRCAATIVQDKWTPIAAGEPCKADDIACTVDACDGKGACVATADDAACKDKDGPCVKGSCDAEAVKGCKTVPLPTSATCEGDDGLSCTTEHCDGAGACDKKQVPSDAACDDDLSCTIDSCDPKAGAVDTGCVHKAVDSACDDGNVCTGDTCAGATGEAKTGCAFVNNSADCTTDGLACTTEQCAGGSCKLTIGSKSCVIDGACVDEGTMQQAGCQSCTPSASQSAWTLAAAGSSCVDDGASCTKDTCSAAGACKHEIIAGACDDGLPCTVDACDPGTAWADSKTGCAFVDDCPYGHSCDGTAKACLTPKPVVLVSESADDPAPTNPVAIRHVLDAKTGRHRLWVVYQSQAAATVVKPSLGGDPEKFGDPTWAINQPSKLRAVVLDPAIAAKPGDTKPKPAVITFANHVVGAGAAAAFPAVAVDPESSSQAWLTWLEAGVGGSPICLDNFGRGGIARLARLDGGAVTSGGSWSAVAGTTCPLDGGDKPAFMTPGFAVLGGASTDPSKRGAIFARPKVDDLVTPASNVLAFGGVVGSPSINGSTLLGAFSTVHPVVIDMGAEDANKARFWVLALGEKNKSGSYTRELWALPLDAKGTDDTPASWLASGSSGAGATVLGGATAVCTLDAAWDADKGEAVVAIVTRGASSDSLWLARGKPGGTWTAKQVFTQGSKTPGSCSSGILGARVVAGKGGAALVTMNTGTLHYPGVHSYFTVSADGAVKPADLLTPSSWSTDLMESGDPRPGLAWRGAAQAVWLGDSWSLVAEGQNGSGKREIVIYTFTP
ncbi:MAG: hypothetical protein H6747_10180 [Deltaproteobacteria bacterium]|nr:hypothetical protein [Deltaproteobacteria bacterium]